ncbi:MAG: hypothetical protein LRY36_02635 [Alphaproteobacteria bacterium]|nr:hypothetical protein [Alphaproteobacteria bacterium]
MQKSEAKGGAADTVRSPLHIQRDLEILRRFFHAPSGAHLVLARVDDYARLDPRPEHPFILAWVAAWQKTVRDYHSVPTKKGASRHFNRMSREKLPRTCHLMRDFQREAVYRWETKHINASNKNRYMSRKAIHKLARSVSRDFGIEPPEVVFVKGADKKAMDAKNIAAYYDPRTHKIELNDRRISVVLHELAHAVNRRSNEMIGVCHGPGFVRIQLYLAQKYQSWVDHKKAEKEAFKAGLLVASMDDLPCFAP